MATFYTPGTHALNTCGAHAYGALRLAGAQRHNSVWGLTAGNAKHNSSNVRGVTANKLGHNSSSSNGIRNVALRDYTNDRQEIRFRSRNVQCIDVLNCCFIYECDISRHHNRDALIIVSLDVMT